MTIPIQAPVNTACARGSGDEIRWQACVENWHSYVELTSMLSTSSQSLCYCPLAWQKEVWVEHRSRIQCSGVQKNSLLTMDFLLHLVYTAIGRWTNYRTNGHPIACCSGLTSFGSTALLYSDLLQACTSTSCKLALRPPTIAPPFLCCANELPFRSSMKQEEGLRTELSGIYRSADQRC